MVDLLVRTLDDLTEPIDREGVEAYAVLLQAMGGEVDDAIARSDFMAPMSSEAAQLDLLRGRSLALAVAGRGEEALPLIAEARKLHESLSADLRRPGLSLVLFAEVLTLGELGRMDAARNTAAKYRGNGIPAMRDWMLLAEARLDLSVGRPGDERQALITLVRTSRGLGLGATERWALALLASGKLLEGDREGARVDLDRVAELEVGERGLFHADIDRAHAWLAAERAGLPTAREMLRVAADDARRLGKSSMEAALLHDIARFGDADSVADGSPSWPRPGRARSCGPAPRTPRASHRAIPCCSIAPPHCSSSAASRSWLPRPDSIRPMRSPVVVTNAAPPPRGTAQRRSGGCCRRRCSLRRWRGRSASSHSAIASTRSRLLAAEGMSSRDIASRLFVSTRTIDNHLQHVYSKLGVNGRDQLVAALGRGVSAAGGRRRCRLILRASSPPSSSRGGARPAPVGSSHPPSSTAARAAVSACSTDLVVLAQGPTFSVPHAELVRAGDERVHVPRDAGREGDELGDERTSPSVRSPGIMDRVSGHKSKHCL